MGQSTRAYFRRLVKPKAVNSSATKKPVVPKIVEGERYFGFKSSDGLSYYYPVSDKQRRVSNAKCIKVTEDGFYDFISLANYKDMLSQEQDESDGINFHIMQVDDTESLNFVARASDVVLLNDLPTNAYWDVFNTTEKMWAITEHNDVVYIVFNNPLTFNQTVFYSIPFTQAGMAKKYVQHKTNEKIKKNYKQASSQTFDAKTFKFN